MKKSKTDAIIFLDLENIVAAKNSNVYIPFFLNLLNKKFNVKTIYSFGRLNTVKNNDLKNDLFYDKNFIKKIILENKEINSKIANLLLHILLLDNVIDFQFMNNKNELQAADKNIVNTIKNKILQNAKEYKNTTIILFSVDSDFKEILNKLTQNQIVNLVIGMPNTNSVCWGNLGLFRFKIEEDLFLMDKNNYLNTYFYPLISQILMKQQIFKEKNNTEVDLLLEKETTKVINKSNVLENFEIINIPTELIDDSVKIQENQIEKNDLEFNLDIDFQNNSDLTIREEEKEIQIENVFKDEIEIEDDLDIDEFNEIENDLNVNNNSEMQGNFFAPVNQNQELDESPRIFINFIDEKNVESNEINKDDIKICNKNSFIEKIFLKIKNIFQKKNRPKTLLGLRNNIINILKSKKNQKEIKIFKAKNKTIEKEIENLSQLLLQKSQQDKFLEITNNRIIYKK